MRRFSKLCFVLLVPAFLGLPSPAQAQSQVRNFRGVNHVGNVGGFHNGRNIIFLGGLGWTPGFGSFGGLPYGSYLPGGYFSPGWNNASPYYPYNNYPNYDSYDPPLVPGFAASEPVRSRLAFYPAIVEPSREVIAAALYGEDKDRARIAMRVPMADAKVYLDGVLTKQTGIERMYVTPQLKSGSRYSLSVEVVWQNEAGQSRTLKRQINVRAGETATLDLHDAN